MKKVKVLIADDSVIYRTQIKAALNCLPWIEVAGVASNGKILLDLMSQIPTELVLLDLEMPEVDGIAALKEIKARGYSAEVVLFSSISKRGAEVTLEALRLGASDFITKPNPTTDKLTDSANPAEKIRHLLEPKITALFPKVALAEPPIQKLEAPVLQVDSYPKLPLDLFSPKVIVIGSSTGGPTALEKIFSAISGPLKCPILITQHMPPVFTGALAERLEKLSRIPTREAISGEVLKNQVYIAPGDFHMQVEGSLEEPKISLNKAPLENFVRPAVDPLFRSAAALFKKNCLGVVLTGMGADGKAGAEEIKKQGGAVVIQSKESCVVFGMPGAVFKSGAFDQIADLSEITTFLRSKAKGV